MMGYFFLPTLSSTVVSYLMGIKCLCAFHLSDLSSKNTFNIISFVSFSRFLNVGTVVQFLIESLELEALGREVVTNYSSSLSFLSLQWPPAVLHSC